MIEQQVIVGRVKVDGNTALQNRRHDRIRRGDYKFLRQEGKQRTVAGLEGFCRRMKGLLNRRLVEVCHEFVLRWCRTACVVDVVDTEAAKSSQIFLHGHLDDVTHQGFLCFK